jgi:squalene cyclase
MQELDRMAIQIPEGLKPYYQEYDPESLELNRDAELIIQRALEFGTWDEVRWLFEVYGAKRIRVFLRQRGERWLKPVAFNYWRKLLGVRRWKHSPFPTSKGELWKF